LWKFLPFNGVRALFFPTNPLLLFAGCEICMGRGCDRTVLSATNESAYFVLALLVHTDHIHHNYNINIFKMTNRTSRGSMPHHVQRPLKGNLKNDEGKRKANAYDKRVDFSSLEVFEFLIQIGDNPSCEGAPLCIGDECQNQYTRDVDAFEASRKARRHRKQLVLSASKRSRM
jgi:hypothetical protein